MDLVAMVVGYAVLGVVAVTLLIMGATWVAYQVTDFLNRSIEVSE